jgi:hypothetical protein
MQSKLVIQAKLQSQLLTSLLFGDLFKVMCVGVWMLLAVAAACADIMCQEKDHGSDNQTEIIMK